MQGRAASEESINSGNTRSLWVGLGKVAVEPKPGSSGRKVHPLVTALIPVAVININGKCSHAFAAATALELQRVLQLVRPST